MSRIAVGHPRPWHPPLPGRLAAPTHAAAWGSAVVGEIGFAQDGQGRWAYARPAGSASDARLEAHRRRRELVRALGYQAQRGEAGPDAAFAAGWPLVGQALPDASGWVRGPAGALAWLAPADKDGSDALSAAARRSAIAAVAERALARYGSDDAQLEAALAPLLAGEVEAFIFSPPTPGAGRVRTFGRAARPAVVLSLGGVRCGQPLAACGEFQLAPGETLVLGSGDAGALTAVLGELLAGVLAMADGEAFR